MRRPRFRLVPLAPRDPREPDRSATTLELFFDLVFVIAVGTAASELHRGLASGHAGDTVASYALMFFAIWWAWMNVTWFATSFGGDDWLYRVLTLVQMAGVLVLAAGIPAVFAEHRLGIAVLGYVIMRVATVAQWLRAARAPGPTRRPARAYAIGVAAVQVLWVAQLALPARLAPVAILVLIAADVAVPVVADRRYRAAANPRHITERYGLFTLIVLGEGLAGSANAVIEALHAGGEHPASAAPLVVVAADALVIVAALWWIYFWSPQHDALTSFAASLRWGYLHYLVFASAGAVAAGVELRIDTVEGAEGREGPAPIGVALALAIPVAVFVATTWLLVARRHADRIASSALLAGAVVVLAAAVTPVPTTAVAAVLVAVVVVLVVRPPVVGRTPPG